MLVEDDLDLRQILVELIAQAGHEVESCGNVPTAQRLIETFGPAVVLIDIGLPVFDGNQLAAHIHDTYVRRPYLAAVTALAREPGRVRSELFDQVIAKPAQWDELSRVLENAQRLAG